MKLKNSVVLFLITLFLAACSSSNIKQRKDWGKYFEENQADGCFMFHNISTGQFEVYNLGEAQQRYLPAGTFLIMVAMAGLETGVISDTNMVLRPDTSASSKMFLSDLTMAEAFRTVNIPWFQEIARRIGRSKMEYWIDSVYYGNKVISTEMDSFWLNNTLKISPDEQVGLLQRMYYGKLAFQPRSQRLVRKLMIKKYSHNDTLCYQTGFGQGKDQQIGWIIGWYKKNDHPYFFALLTRTPDPKEDLQKKSFNILNSVLKDEGLGPQPLKGSTGTDQ
jgi:beta-lactamase class D